MGSLFKPKVIAPPPAPEPTPPAPMPDTSSPGVLEANRRAQQQIMARAGRSSTILTAPENRGGAYTATKLGSES
ncbi:MAG: hypothetical protein JWN71_2792 [Xanthobacteraceae bacterium]|jgi:hypothetical protein|nr:hypothetical protein [Xanthobacteraceae bacterium]